MRRRTLTRVRSGGEKAERIALIDEPTARGEAGKLRSTSRGAAGADRLHGRPFGPAFLGQLVTHLGQITLQSSAGLVAGVDAAGTPPSPIGPP